MIWSQLINICEARVRILSEPSCFLRLLFLQSAELQLIRKDQDFNLFSVRRSKKNYFIVKKNEPSFSTINCF